MYLLKLLFISWTNITSVQHGTSTDYEYISSLLDKMRSPSWVVLSACVFTEEFAFFSFCHSIEGSLSKTTLSLCRNWTHVMVILLPPGGRGRESIVVESLGEQTRLSWQKIGRRSFPSQQKIYQKTQKTQQTQTTQTICMETRRTWGRWDRQQCNSTYRS